MDIAFTSVADLKHMIDAKELSIVEIVESVSYTHLRAHET